MIAVKQYATRYANVYPRKKKTSKYYHSPLVAVYAVDVVGTRLVPDGDRDVEGRQDGHGQDAVEAGQAGGEDGGGGAVVGGVCC